VFVRSVFIAWRVRGPCHFDARLFISGRFAVFVRSVFTALRVRGPCHTTHSGRFAVFVRSVFICVYCVVCAWISGRFAVFVRSVFIAWCVRGFRVGSRCSLGPCLLRGVYVAHATLTQDYSFG